MRSPEPVKLECAIMPVMTDVDDLIAAGADVWAVACNYREATNVARVGARALLAWTTGGQAYESLHLLVTSRGGRQILKWERARRLTNFRATCLPSGHPLRPPVRQSARDAAWSGPKSTQLELYPNRAAAEARAAEMMTVSRRVATERRTRDA